MQLFLVVAEVVPSRNSFSQQHFIAEQGEDATPFPSAVGDAPRESETETKSR